MAEGVLHRVARTALVARPAVRTLFTESGTGATSAVLSDVKEVTTPKSIDDLPGPQGYPFLGTAPEYFRKKNRGRMHEVQRSFHQKYGKFFKERLGPVTNVSVADPDLIEDLLRSEGKYPLRPPYDSWLLYKQLRQQKNGIMSAVGEEWHRYRSATSRKLMRPKNALEYVDSMNDVVTSLINRINHVKDVSGSESRVSNLPNELYKWAAESVACVLLETRMGCLDNEMLPKIQSFIDSVGKMFLTGHQLMVFANIHKKLNTKPWREHVQSWDTIYSVAQELIDEQIEKMNNEPEEKTDEEARVPFLKYLLGTHNFSTEETYTNTTELLLSGVDTASNTLGFSLWLLANNPGVQERLQEEVDSVLQNRVCSADDLQTLRYVKLVVKETLRLYPVIPINARVTTEDTIIDNHLIPKGTCILLNNYTMSRDEKHFPKPDEFLPERWMRDEKDFHPFCVIPFGFGARSCLGRRIAEQILYLSIVRISQKFWLQPHSQFTMKPTLRTVLTLGKEIPLEFINR